MAEVSKELWAEYGMVTANLEIAQNRFNEVKKKLVDEMNKKEEPKAE